MWAAAVVGIFGVLGLLVKALVDAGSRNSRIRSGIKLDLDVLVAMPKDMPHREEFARLIDSDVAGMIDQRTSVVPPTGFPIRLKPAERVAWWTAFVVALAVGVTLFTQALLGNEAAPWNPFGIILFVIANVALTVQAAISVVSWRRVKQAASERRRRRLAAAQGIPPRDTEGKTS